MSSGCRHGSQRPTPAVVDANQLARGRNNSKLPRVTGLFIIIALRTHRAEPLVRTKLRFLKLDSMTPRLAARVIANSDIFARRLDEAIKKYMYTQKVKEHVLITGSSWTDRRIHENGVGMGAQKRPLFSESSR